MSEGPLVSVIVVSYNTWALLRDCLHSIYRNANDLPVEVWVVDNASTDGSADIVAAQFPQVQLIRNQHNAGFSVANNQALARTRGKFILFLNSDTALFPDSLQALVAAFARYPLLGICGVRLLNPDGSTQPSWGELPSVKTEFLFQSFLFKVWPYRYVWGRRVHFLLASAYSRFQWAGWVSGAALMLRREVYEQIGGLLEDYFFGGEDIDFCARARSVGFQIAYVPEARVTHYLSASSRRDYARRIENYTRAMLLYYETHMSPAALRRVAHIVIWGSILRMAIWRMVAQLQSSRKVEAEMRYAGYRLAATLARCVLDGEKP